ncbi:MAG: tetratricopeptide repeat protein [Candidatus Lokiarchaeota archaeon]|nr:tetratricopeptide repeat protein [Candidatus Lokiarchaeota archaeon]
MDKIIRDYLKQGKLCFFLGAGISMGPPACLPSWWQINHAILDSLANETFETIPKVKELVDLIKKRESDGQLPPEFVSEIVTNRIGKSYFEVLRVLESEQPNESHLWLATLAKVNLLKVIITTNFDTLVEKAFEKLATPLMVLLDPEDYISIGNIVEFISNPESPCLLLKLHGTSTRPDTCIDTLAQRKKGLNPIITDALNAIGTSTFMVFLGYSGADLEAEPNYLGLRQRMNDAPGIMWLQYKGTNTLQVVKDLASLYGPNRGFIEYGLLPDWFDNLSEILPPSILPPDRLKFSDDMVREIKSKNEITLKQKVQLWASNVGFGESAIVLTDIGIHAGFYDVTKLLLEEFLDKTEEEQLTTFGKALLYEQLGSAERNKGNIKSAKEYYDMACKIFREIGELEAYHVASQGRGDANLHLGNFEEAENDFSEYMNYSETRGDTEDYLSALQNLSNLYRQTDQYQASLNLAKEIEEVSEKNGLEFYKAQGTFNAALALNALGENNLAERAFIDTIAIFERLGFINYLSQVYMELSRLYFDKGLIGKANELLSEAEKKAYLVGDELRIIRIKKIKADFLIKKGNFSEAIPILEEIFSKIEEHGDIDLTLAIMQNLGLAYQMNGNEDDALKIYENAVRIAESAGIDSKSAGIKINIGIIFEQRGILEEALSYYADAEAIFKRLRVMESLSEAQGNMGNVYFRLGNLEEAKKFYELALETSEKVQNIDNILRNQFNIANILGQSGDHAGAKIKYKTAIETAKKYELLALKDAFQINYAGFLFQLEDYSEAIEAYGDAYISSVGRKDYNQAGISMYYSGLAYFRINDFEKGIKSLEEALESWDMLSERPAQYQEALKVLNQAKQQLGLQ